MKRDKYTPTQKQKQAFKAVIRAMRKAQAEGLRFFGKQNYLCAYTTLAVEKLYNLDRTEQQSKEYKEYIQDRSDAPKLYEPILTDCGADDPLWA